MDLRKSDEDVEQMENIGSDLNDNQMKNEEELVDVVSIGQWFKIDMISMIPIIGFIYQIFLLCKDDVNQSIKNEIIANLIFIAIFVVIILLYIILSIYHYY